MNERKASVRVLSFFLALVMFVGLLPVNALAEEVAETTDATVVTETTEATEVTQAASEPVASEEPSEPEGDAAPSEEVTESTEEVTEPAGEEIASYGLARVAGVLDAAIFCSDLHGKTTNLVSILGQLKNTGVTYSSIGLVGDTCLTVSSVTSTISNALGYTPNVMFSYAASHDTEDGADIDENWDYSGEVEGVSAYYLVYTIRETDMQNTSGANTAAPAFTTWYNGLTDAQKKLPIFIISHRPLHDRRDDNAGAATWYNAISAAAKTSDIVFFWAHNHTGDNEVDQAAYYVAKNGSETFTVYNGSTVVPNFTYMNAGYIDANGQNPARKPVATTVQITADSLVFQDYTTSGKYTNSSYSHNVTVAREFAATEPEATLSSISVSGTTEYYVGDTFVAPTVKAVYSDGSTEDITSECTFSGYDMSAAGTQTVTVTWGEETTTYEITVTAVQLNTIAVTTPPTKLNYLTSDTALDTTGMVITGTYNNGTTAELSGWYTSAVDMTTAGEKTVTVNYAVDGITYKTTFTITVEQDISGLTLTAMEITTDPTITEYQLNDALDITGMVVTATFSDGTTRSLTYGGFATEGVSETLCYYIDGFEMYVEKQQTVTVTYTHGDVTLTDTFVINVWNYTFSDTTSGVTVAVADQDFGVTAVTVKDSENTNVSTAIADVIKSGTYVAYDITLTLDTKVDSEESYALTSDAKTVTLPIPEGVTNPVVYFVSDDGKTVEKMSVTANEDGTLSFTTTHFSTYVVGESAMTGTESEAEVPGSSVTTYTPVAMTVYKLVATPESGKTYLIVNSNDGTGYGLDGDTTGYATTKFEGGEGYYSSYDESAQSGTAFSAGSDVYLTTNGAYLWTAGSNSFTIGYTRSSDGDFISGGTYSYTLNPSGSGNAWTLNGSQLTINLETSYRGIFGGSSASDDFYLTNNGSSWSMATSGAANVYFYEPVTIYTLSESTTGTQTATYGMYITYPDSDGNYVDTQQAITAHGVLPNETLQLGAVFTSTVDGQTPPSGGTWTITSSNSAIATVDNTGKVTYTGAVGETLIQATYSWEQDGVSYSVSNYVAITVAPPDHYSIELHYANLTEVASDASFDSSATYYVYNDTTNVFEQVSITAFEDGVTYYTTPVIKGAEITSTIALKGIEAGDRYPIWAVVKAYATADDTTGTDLGDLDDDLLYWTVSDTSIATIDPTTGVITFTGTNYGTFTVTVSYTGADGKVITDTITISATKSLYVVPGDGTDDFPEYPNQGAVRFDKTATAVGNFSETGIAKVELSMTGVPYSSGKSLDVLLMLDMSTSMDTEVADGVDRVDVTITAAKAFAKTILVNDDGTFTGNYIAIKYFNGSSVYTTTDWVTVTSESELEALYDLIEALYTPTSSGTYYSVAMKDCYDTIIARDAVSDNTQALVFMSDGGPTYYTYVDGDSYSTVSNSPATIVGWFDVDDNDTSSDETDDTATPNSSFKQEYYSTQLKALGYPVYTVGLGLANNDTGPSAFTGLTSGAHEAITSYILAQMATNSSYFYSIADSDAVSSIGNVFSAIAASIKEAATDVTVEDKIGSDYNLQFKLPTKVTSEMTDGLSEFYIQVVDYVLDTTTHERTGSYTVLENFTFNTDGSLKSHTVDGVTCGDTCSHVTLTDGVITKIDGTYFDYEVKSDGGEYLTWEAEKLSSTELALQYFVYLENSADKVGTSDEIKAGTYYTNEYATLTYTNVNSKVVQQEFPIPQMTWNGAQVSYVFYLVNEHGQPVNRAGKVVPFAEAVYVTDVYTYYVIWNDLEQSAGLEAEYLAADKLPDAFELYDNGAYYNIHVYEDEEQVNLNNHFVIGTGFTSITTTNGVAYVNVCDDNNNYDDLAYTTYVFNNKSDTTKYYAAGAYIANDGSDATDSTTYLCKGDGTVTATIGEASGVNSENFSDSAYYTKDTAGNYELAATFTEGVTYYTITEASYTAASGETQWTPGTDDSTSGGVVLNGYVYYIDENNQVYTIVSKTNGTEVYKGFDFANTTVAFAVVWKPELEPDTVVVDYGLDVVIDVIKNDNMAAGVVGVRVDAPSGITENSGNYTAAKATSAEISIGDLVIGTATVENLNSVRFSLNEDNGMQFTDPAVFYYEADVNYYNSSNQLQTTSMYSKVTVIPATTIYYEDSFLTYSASGTSWVDEGTAVNATQAQDRPGASKISTDLDADNNYGYDAAYSEMSTFSLGSAKKVTVNADSYATASFTFYGTGFDVISMTSNTTGTLAVKVTDEDGNVVKSVIVDTYYGYTQDEEGNWVTTSNTPNALYQVPVIQVEGLDYDQYTVLITATYGNLFDHNGSGSYDLYLDAIRIYDPTGNKNESANAAYVLDGEGWPSYTELRNNIIAAQSYSTTENTDGTVTVSGNDLSGAIFIDCSDDTTSIADYVSYGPNNELYLDVDQAIAFNVGTTNVADVQLGIKSASGKVVTYEINGTACTVKTASDMYYSILEYATAGTVTIKNTSGGILSLTNIKVTYASDPGTVSTASVLSMDAESAGIALMSLRSMPVVEETETEATEETQPETEETETTAPETEETQPETETAEPETEETQPETEATEPETEETQPETEATEPEEDNSDVGSKVEEVIEKIGKVIRKIFGWLFG